MSNRYLKGEKDEYAHDMEAWAERLAPILDAAERHPAPPPPPLVRCEEIRAAWSRAACQEAYMVRCGDIVTIGLVCGAEVSVDLLSGYVTLKHRRQELGHIFNVPALLIGLQDLSDGYRVRRIRR